jgi:N-acetylneuraminic acid mutarotase
LLVFAACHHPSGNSSDGALPDSPAPCAGGSLFAFEPQIASAGTTLALEGAFPAPGSISFPGGANVAFALSGPNRATVDVPNTALSGTIVPCSGGPVPLAFQRVTFPLGLGSFTLGDGQAGGAQRDAVLFAPTTGYSAHVIGNAVYIVGGGNGQYTSDVERATINADGTLGSFTFVPGLTLTFPRGFHTGTVIGNFLYVVGGTQGTAYLDSVDRATINADGTLGAFDIVPNVNLHTARGSHTAAVIGAYLYVFGGVGNSSTPPGVELDSVERAPIAADGSLGAFEVVAAVTLATARGGHTTDVIGNTVYVIGGGDGTYPLANVEQAAIAGDGSIGPFSIVPGLALQTPRVAHATAIYGGSLYVVGGFGGFNFMNHALASIERTAIHTDGTLDGFAVLPSSSLAIARSNFALVHVGNALYAVSGAPEPGNPSLASCERATIDENGTIGAFAGSAMLASARTGHATVITGSHLYAIGGNDGSAPLGTIDVAAIHPDGSLDPPLAATTTLAVPRSGFATASVWSYVYAIGGRDASGSAIASIERAPLDPNGVLGSFAIYPVSSLVTPRERHSAAVVGETIYVVGGRDASGNVLGSVERVTVNLGGSLQSFATVTGVTLATPRFGHASAVFGNRLYVFGGTDASGHALASVEAATIQQDGTLSAFAAVSGVALATPRTGLAAAVASDQLWIAGGSSDSGALATLERATIQRDGVLQTFAPVAGIALATARGEAGFALAGNYAYVVGGTSGTSALASVERAPLQ